METRVGVVSILIESASRELVQQVNGLLSEYGDIIIGRLGVPYRERHVNVIAIIVDGTTDQVGALTGKLGSLPNVTTKASLLTR